MPEEEQKKNNSKISRIDKKFTKKLQSSITFGPSAGASLHALFGGRIALDSQSDLLEAAFLQQLLRHVAVLDVSQEAAEHRTRDGCELKYSMS